MVVTATGENPDTTLTQYTGDSEVVKRHGKLYVYDAGAGEMIADISPDAANALRHHQPARLIFDGQRITLEAAQ